MKYSPLVLVVSALALACSSGGKSSATADDAGTTPAAADAAAALPKIFDEVKEAVWTAIPGAPKLAQGKMDDIFMLSDTLGFAVNPQAGALLKTTDGGGTWTTVLSSTTAYFRAVHFVDAQHGFVGNLGPGLDPSISDTTLLYETKDGGANWAPVTQITGSSPGGVCNITSLDAQHIMAIGRTNGPAHVVRSNDGGASWESKDLSAQLSMLIDGHMVSESESLIVGMSADAGSKCTALRSIDGGKTYTQVFKASASRSLCWKIDFPTPSTGYIAIQQTSKGPPSFAKTVDGGKTWVEMPLPALANPTAAYPALSVSFINDKIGWVAAESAQFPSYRTLDGGETWEVDAALKAPINRMLFVNDHLGYAIGGTVWKLAIPKHNM